jgi:hypothetical protein
MPRFRITAPDGGVYEVNAPEGATEQDAIAYVQANMSRIPRAETSVLRDVGGALVQGVGGLVSLPGQLAGLATGDMDNVFTRAGRSVEEFGEELQTPAFRERQRQQAQRVAEAGEEGFLSGAAQQARELLSDPLSLAAGIARSVPSMLGAGVGGLAGRAAARAAIGQTAARGGTLTGAATGEAALISGDAAQAAFDRVSQMPDEVVARSAAYQEAIAEGATPEEARNAAAISAARTTAAVAAPVAAVTGPLGIEARLLTGGVTRGLLRGAGEGVLREGGTEVVQEVGQGVAENIGAQTIDPNVEITEGLGGRAAAGFILGGATGAGVGAVSGLRAAPVEGEPDVTPETDTGIPDGGIDGGPPAPTGIDTGAPPTGGGVETGPATPTGEVEVDINGQRITADVFLDGEGNVVIDYGEPGIEILTPEQWAEKYQIIRPALEPGVETGPVTTEPVVEPVSPVETPVAEPAPIETPVVEPATPTGSAVGVAGTGVPVGGTVAPEAADVGALTPKTYVDRYLAGEGRGTTETDLELQQYAANFGAEIEAEFARRQAAPVPVDTPSGPIEVTPPRSPVLDRPIEDIEPITPEQFAAAETATAEIQSMISGKTMPQVARTLAETATLDTTRIIMPRVANILDAFEKSGIQLRIGVQTRGKQGILGIKLESRTRGQASWRSWDTSMNVVMRGMNLQNPGVSERTLAHELIHAVTVLGIEYQNKLPKNSRVGTAINELRDLSSFVAQRMEADGQFKGKYLKYRSDPNEILAWGLTDNNFQNYLKTIPTKTGNAFTDFVRYIGKLLGVGPKDQNALARLIEISEGVIPERQQDVADVAAGAAAALGVGGLGGGTTGQVEAAAQPTPTVSLPQETRRQAVTRKMVDEFERLRVAQSLGQIRQGVEGFYQAARKFSSRAGELMQKFNRDYGRPMKELVRKAGIKLSDLDLYLYSKAAPEINSHFEKQEIRRLVRKEGGDPSLLNKVAGTNPNFDMNQRDRDWAPDQPRWSHPDPAIDAKILAEYNKPNTKLLSGAGISNVDAFNEWDAVENGTKGTLYKDMAKLHRESVKWLMDNSVARGLISRQFADELLRDVPHYVPLKGQTKAGQNLSDADFSLLPDDLETQMAYGGTGFSISKSEWRQRRGRTTLPFSPYSTFVSDAAARIIRGERNRVGQKMMDFFIDNPSDEWKVFSDRNPPRDYNGRPYYPKPSDREFVTVKRGGNTFYLRINDPLLAKAAKNLNPQQMNIMLQISNKITRLLSRSFTTANPDFFVPNVFRDLQAAALNLEADAPGLARAFARKVKDKEAFRAIAAFEYGRPIRNAKLAKRIENFKLDGGSVSWAAQATPEEVAIEIQRDLKTVNDSLKDIKNARNAKQVLDAVWAPTSKGFRAMVGALENTNAIFENGIRFAAYEAAIEVLSQKPMPGLTPEQKETFVRDQAAMISREATVDFNRRGEAGALLNALYAFFNAGIQGSVRTARALSNNPFKTGKLSTTQSALLGMMGTAAMLAAAGAAMSEEDDDGKLFWDKIPDYDKERNLIIMHPNGRSYEKIPMPYGFGFFPYVATRVMDAARRGDDLGSVGLDLTTAAIGNFSPIQFGGENLPGSVARAAAPTAIKPLVELMLNENAFGRPIYNEPFDSGESYASAARYNTWDGFKDFSQFLNDISGGEGRVKGRINAPPESFEHLLEFSFGGLVPLAKTLYKTADEGDPLSAPVVRRLVGQPGKGRNVGEYYEREETARVVNRQLKDSTPEERAALRERFPVETSPRVQAALTTARSRIRELNAQRKRINNMNLSDGEKSERLEALRERIDGEYVRFNRVYNQVEQASR